MMQRTFNLAQLRIHQGLHSVVHRYVTSPCARQLAKMPAKSVRFLVFTGHCRHHDSPIEHLNLADFMTMMYSQRQRLAECVG
ncbi:hypothetical protein WR31_31775 [Burkholderia contaminans LMG 23361]|uniref:Transposase n=1 Tax=Burkholderia contaminans LMG 23361 TaxID=1334628 RepID=A0ABD4AKF1_9BURK|nr:hypothetical protein WR31_31775 [Burkholderia contaminans LMG 23361]